MDTRGRGASPVGRLAIIAGRGSLPFHIANAARAANDDPFIIGLTGEAGEISDQFDHAFASVGDAARIFKLLRDNEVARVILSGGVNRRPEIGDIRFPLRSVLTLPRVINALLGAGDDKLLRLVISLMESVDCQVVGAQEIVPDLLATIGTITRCKPIEKDWKNIGAAGTGAMALGKLDVGQGAVAIGGRIVALEAAEGTDGMLHRVRELRAVGRISKKRKGVLVKLCKPQQDERADMPSIGPDTIRIAHEAGLTGVAIEAGRAFILDRSDVILEADRLGLFVVGVDRDQITGSS